MRLFRAVRWNDGRFDIIAALPGHFVNDRTHARLEAYHGPAPGPAERQFPPQATGGADVAKG
jgi:hypothetical protein